MSYILDSIKKSEQEREKGQSETLQKLKAPAYLDNAGSNTPIIIILTAILVLVSMLVALYFFTLLNREDAKPDALVNAQTVTKPMGLQTSEPDAQDQSVTAGKGNIVGDEVGDDTTLGAQPPAVNDTVASLYERIPDTPGEATNQPETIGSKTEESDFYALEAEAPPGSGEQLATDSVTEAEIQPDTDIVNELSDDIPPLFSLDVLEQRRIPSINYGAHIYASDNRSGFVILNGARMKVGQSLDNGVFVEKINEEDVVLSYNGLLFSLPAMKSWNNQ